eukprot:m.1307687 g.1307687  ORF g.1307687 m.1307687 type:complete len:239 (-) comp24818_c0_seq20:4235-4951(-)
MPSMNLDLNDVCRNWVFNTLARERSDMTGECQQAWLTGITQRGHTLLHYALRDPPSVAGVFSVVEALHASEVLTEDAYHGLLKTTTDNGWSLIHTGMFAGDQLCIARLLDEYLDAGLPDGVLHEMLTSPLPTTGQTPLLLGIQGKASAKALKLYVSALELAGIYSDHGIEDVVCATSNTGHTILHAALRRRDLDILRATLDLIREAALSNDDLLKCAKCHTCFCACLLFIFGIVFRQT